MMSLLWQLCFLVSIKTIWIVAKEFLDNSPGCFDSCSDQVNCTISPYSYGFCGAGMRSNLSHGPDIAAEPVDLKVEKLQDEEHQYVHLSWRPPEDGSYNYLTGFLVQVTVINLDPVHTGVTGTSCYRVLPVDNWYQTHRSLYRIGGVVFFMNCLRSPAQSSMDLVISIHSLPLKSDAPKLAMAKVNIEPGNPAQIFCSNTAFWNPRFDKWADTDDVMHLVIQNPLKEARYYGVQIKSVENDRMVFSHVYPAHRDNTTLEQLMVFNKDGLPHFIVPGLNKGDNYSILMDVLDGNKTGLPHMRSIQTNPFRLNFTSLPLPISEPASRGLDNRLIIIVSVLLVIVVAVLVCLIWKGVVRPNKLSSLVRVCAFKIDSKNRPSNTTFLPIYCHENDHFVATVEYHVKLLRRCFEALNPQPTSKTGNPFCCSVPNDGSMVDDKNKDCDFIIYLSPRLGNILKCGQTCPAEYHRQDVLCHQALLALSDLRLNGLGAIPLLVTFDCFEQAELTYLDDLMVLIFPPHLGTGAEMSTPLRLASFNQTGWRVENVEVICRKLNRHKNLSPNIPSSLHGWREFEEARAVERYLSLLWETKHEELEEMNVSWNRKRYLGSPKLDFVYYSNSGIRSHDDLARSRSFNDRFDTYQDDLQLGNSHEKIRFLQNVSLVSSSSNIKPLPESRSADNFLYRGILPNNYLKSPGLRYKVDVAAPETATAELDRYRPAYHFSPTECAGYRPTDPNDISDSVQIIKGQRSTRLGGVASYKPNIFGNNVDNVDATSVNSVESDLLLRTNDLNSYVRRRDHLSNDLLEDAEVGLQKVGYRVAERKDIIVPPSLSYSNFTSMESVCERINRVNEHSGWNELNMTK